MRRLLGELPMPFEAGVLRTWVMMELACVFAGASLVASLATGPRHWFAGSGALVSLRPAARVTAEALKAFVGEQLAPFKAATYVDLRSEELPRNAADPS